MAALQTRISPCLWFDTQGEEAAQFYTSIFPNSKIGHIERYGEAGKEIHGQKPGGVMTVDFTLDWLDFVALNGGPIFKFTEAVSFQIYCADQKEVDYYWDRLTVGGDPAAQQCGWVKDKFGLSWQIVPRPFIELMKSGEPAKKEKMFAAMMQMRKLDWPKLKAAYDS
jgi:predicted 3-demethylubiquinone-9 3-methyltransferase (glyoxalase superfamily)